MRLLATVLVCQPLVASAFDHGPLVHWNEDPSQSTDLIWIEKGGNPGVEKVWSVGPAGFGYGDSDDETVFPNMQGNYDSIAIRHEMKIPENLPDGAQLILLVDYDDGFVAWINGREVARKNVKGEGKGMKASAGREAGGMEEFPLNFPLKAGETLRVALQGFNFGIDSSDLSLHPLLVLKSGDAANALIRKNADWEYLANAVPEDGWQTKLAKPEKAASASSAGHSVKYRLKGADHWQPVAISFSPLAASRHKVIHARLAGLPNGKDIEFRTVRGTGEEGEIFTFRMPPAIAGPIRFVTGGDIYHRLEPMNRMNRRAGLEDPLFALVGGDLAYSNDNNPERWFTYFDSWVENVRAPDGRLVPKIIAIGNHEIRTVGYHPKDAPGPDAAREFFSLFRFPGGKDNAHTVDFGDWFSVMVLDSGHSRGISPQTPWLEKTLRERGKFPHVFACYHRPAYGAGSKPDAVDIQQEWSPLFEKFRVTAVFENDHHIFARSHPVREGKVDEKDGIPYLGAGAWSVEPRKFDPEGEGVKKRPWVAKAASVNHIYVVETRGGGGFRATAKGFDGEVIDEYEREWKR